MKKYLIGLILFFLLVFNGYFGVNIETANAQIPTDGLVGYWSFDENSGDIANDISGNNNDGTIYGATWTNGVSGSALMFNGLDNYVSLPSSTLGNWDGLTYLAWVNLPKYLGSGWPGIIGSTTTSYSNNNNLAISRNSEHLHLEIDTDVGNYEFEGKIQIPWDTWIHVALVYDGTSLIEYVNGEKGNSISASGNLKSISELNIGQHSQGLYFLNGQIDEVQIYNRPLTKNEIQDIYHELSPLNEQGLRENKAAEKSPLSSIIDKKYVPVIATAVSVFFIFLWNILGSSFYQFINDFFASYVRGKKSKDKKVRKNKDFSFKLIKNMDIKEIVSIFLAIIIFAVSMSWTWSIDISGFIELFFINILVVSFIIGLRESCRLYLSHKKMLKTEYVFWPFGALLTLGSTFLGNTFSLTYYIVFENEDNAKKFGEMYFYIYLLLYGLSLSTFILNFLVPSVVLQMIFVFTIMGVFVFMTPIKPMTGYNIKNWNFKIFLIFYVIVSISYLIMNFSIY